MKNLICILSCLLLLVNTVIAQDQPFYTSYDWEAIPTYKLPAQNDSPMIALDHKTVTEFYFLEDGALVEYYLEHEALVLNSDDKIEAFNKIYLPFSASTEIVVNKARVITPERKIIEVDPSKVFESTDEETGNQYQYFALEGIEKGSIVERMYVYKRYPKYNGNRCTLQDSYYKKQASFDLYAPENFEFAFKSYNGLPEMKEDTLTKNKRHWTVAVKDIKALEEEETASFWANTQFVVYKLDKNLATNKVGVTSYADVVKRIYGLYYETLSKKVNKGIDSFIKSAIGKETNPEEQLRKLDNYIKSNVYQANGNDEKFEDLAQILNTKVANNTGLMKLYTAALNALGVDHEMVITSNRQNIKFDETFEAFNFLDEFLFYYPAFESYVSPTDFDTRYGFPSAYYTDNYGLFIKEVALGDFTSGVGKIKYIKAPEAAKSMDNMLINVSFDENDITNTKVTLEDAMSGYYALYFQPYMHLADQENKDKLLESFAERISENITITHKEMINGHGDLFGVKPIIIKVDFESNAFIEKAGNKYLFKLGELIGGQQELYQEKERVLPVESEFNRGYERTLTVTLPQGYTVANLEDIKINNSYVDEAGEAIFTFASDYELQGNVLTISADEFYKKNIVPASAYEGYRRVINSAADFNKITLVLQKQ